MNGKDTQLDRVKRATKKLQYKVDKIYNLNRYRKHIKDSRPLKQSLQEKRFGLNALQFLSPACPHKARGAAFQVMLFLCQQNSSAGTN